MILRVNHKFLHSKVHPLNRLAATQANHVVADLNHEKNFAQAKKIRTSNLSYYIYVISIIICRHFVGTPKCLPLHWKMILSHVDSLALEWCLEMTSMKGCEFQIINKFNQYLGFLTTSSQSWGDILATLARGTTSATVHHKFCLQLTVTSPKCLKTNTIFYFMIKNHNIITTLQLFFTFWEQNCCRTRHDFTRKNMQLSLTIPILINV